MLLSPLPLPDFRPLGDAAVRVGFGDRALEGLVEAIRGWCALLDRERIPGVRDWVPSVAAVSMFYDPRAIRYATLCERLSRISLDPDSETLPTPRRLVIPVLYGGARGPDLPLVARHAGMTVDAVIRRHAGADYRVTMIGFAPGFPYLAGLDPALTVPRLDRPRPRVPRGSVGIGGEQTGVYTVSTPGGWQIIGWTAVRLFDPDRNPACLLAPGDRVRFLPVEEEHGAAWEDAR